MTKSRAWINACLSTRSLSLQGNERTESVSLQCLVAGVCYQKYRPTVVGLAFLFIFLMVAVVTLKRWSVILASIKIIKLKGKTMIIYCLGQDYITLLKSSRFKKLEQHLLLLTKRKIDHPDLLLSWADANVVQFLASNEILKNKKKNVKKWIANFPNRTCDAINDFIAKITVLWQKTQSKMFSFLATLRTLFCQSILTWHFENVWLQRVS